MGKRRDQAMIVGNWKMHKTRQEALAFVKELRQKLTEPSRAAYLAVPFTYIEPLAKEAEGSPIVIGAQNMNAASEGAFTGEIAGKMLIDVGARFVLIGHSERRNLYGETDEIIRKKIRRAIDDGLPPILCIGETLQEHESGKKEEVLRRQLSACLEGVQKAEANRICVAYEPVWAIGTGRSATAAMAQETQAFCRQVLKDLVGVRASADLPILYGGSVKPENAEELLKQEDVDGLLIGGASLSLASFSEIVNHRG